MSSASSKAESKPPSKAPSKVLVKGAEPPCPECYGNPQDPSKCARCVFAASCKAFAIGEPGLRQGHSVEYDDAIAAPAEAQTVPGPDEEADGGGGWELAALVNRLALAVVDASDGNPLRIGIVFARLAGLSLRDIGDRCRVSKQGIHKHIREVSKKNSKIGELLAMRLSERAGAEIIKTSPLLADYNQTLRRAQWTRPRNNS